MQRRHRISGNRRHSKIHREGTSAANRLLVIRLLPNGLDHSRFAFVVSKRIGNAVVRNRIKRRLRESVRGYASHPGWDAVFIARRGSGDASFAELNQAAANLLRRSPLGRGEKSSKSSSVAGSSLGGTPKTGGELSE